MLQNKAAPGTGSGWRRDAARAVGLLTSLPLRLNRRTDIGAGFLGNGRLRISGPGRVRLGTDVNAWSHAEVNRLITVQPQATILIGANARLNGCTLIAAQLIEVGANTVLGSCLVYDQENYTIDPKERRRPGPVKPVIIEDNVWIGGQVTVLPGIRIGRNSVVGIHSVVMADVPADVVVAGNPARVVRRLDDR